MSFNLFDLALLILIPTTLVRSIVLFLIFRKFFVGSFTAIILFLFISRTSGVAIEKLHITDILQSIDLSVVVYWNVPKEELLINLSFIFTHLCLFLRRISLGNPCLRRLSLVFCTRCLVFRLNNWLFISFFVWSIIHKFSKLFISILYDRSYKNSVNFSLVFCMIDHTRIQ